jgi:hypothetical protein
MKHCEAFHLRELEKKEFCSNHAFVAETYLGLTTGDLVCSRCGHELSKYRYVYISSENEFRYALSSPQ